jgi:hypothetical protein
VDLTKSPLFNVDFIDNWRPAAGIEIHWTVDALLNLLASGSMMVLPLALALLVVHRRDLGRREGGGAGLLLLIGGAALYFGALVYGFAIDPKPRMFLPVAAVACVTIGVLGSVAWERGGRPLICASWPSSASRPQPMRWLASGATRSAPPFAPCRWSEHRASGRRRDRATLTVHSPSSARSRGTGRSGAMKMERIEAAMEVPARPGVSLRRPR